MGQADAILCSPPYADQVIRARTSVRPISFDKNAYCWGTIAGGAHAFDAYGTAEGQVGALKSGPCPGGEAEVGDVETLTWGGCYKDSWKGLIVPEAFAHPAKVARGLAVRLLDHGFARGWWKKGDLVCDPFMGVCGFGIIAAYKRLRFVGVEIEERFHRLCLENVALHRRRWAAGGDPVPVCLLGDSRQFAALVAGAAGVITSPPWGDVEPQNDKAFRAPHDSTGNLRGSYGTTPGQLGGLPQGDADGVITSPPYADTGSHGSMTTGAVDCNSWADGRPRKMGPSMNAEGYGATPGQLGGLPAGDADSVITSPPYADVHETRSPAAAESRRARDRKHRAAIGRDPASPGSLPRDQYGDTPGNVGGLPAGDAGAVVTSPPYEDLPLSDDQRKSAGSRRWKAGDGALGTVTPYGTAPGQVGALRQETYWDAVRCIYGQCLLALRPGGVMAVVVKAFVRKRAVVDLPGQTWRLLLALGFLPVERIRCLLTEEAREPSLFGGECVRRTERASFFRRLATKKGAPSIDFEEILVVRRPPGVGV